MKYSKERAKSLCVDERFSLILLSPIDGGMSNLKKDNFIFSCFSSVFEGREIFSETVKGIIIEE